MLPNLATWIMTELSHLNEQSQVRDGVNKDSFGGILPDLVTQCINELI